MSERELLVKVEGRGVDGGVGVILVYRYGDQISIVATEELNGDAEVLLQREAALQLAAALGRANESTR